MSKPGTPMRALARDPTTNDIMQMKIDADRMRRVILDKKQQIHVLELESSKLDELKVLLRDMLISFQEKGQLHFFDLKSASDMPLLDPIECAAQIKVSVSELLDKHMLLTHKFEHELEKERFRQHQETENAKRVLEMEKEKVRGMYRERNHNQALVDMVVGQKTMMQRTLMMSQKAVERRQDLKESSRQEYKEKVQKHVETLAMTQAIIENKIQEGKEIAKKLESKKKDNEIKIEYHETLLAQKEQIKQEFKKISYDQSCLLSSMDRAKEELDVIQRTNESFMANMKTHELLDAERENERLRNLLMNEKKRNKSNLDAQLAKTKQLEATLEKIAQETYAINDQISDAEQKMQAVTMRIPDFAQLQQALDKVVLNAQNNKNDVLQTQYMLDEIRDKNRLLDIQEYNESRARTQLLLQKLPDPTQFEDF